VQRSIDIVVLGLAITSSWGNGQTRRLFAERAIVRSGSVRTEACAVPPVPAPLSTHDILRAAATS
jgi:hypothetical protein